jgi:hypothetical protein
MDGQEATVTRRGLANDKDNSPTDDFKRIKGIGGVIARQLQASGIRTYVELAMLPPEAIAKRLSDVVGVSPHRVVNEDWIGQARELAVRVPDDDEHLLAGSGQHYENFVVRIRLDDDNDVRSTTIEHIQSGESKRWAAWERAKLAEFIEAQAELSPHAVPGPAQEITAAARREAVAEPGVTPGPSVIAAAELVESGATPEPVGHAAGELTMRPEADMVRAGEPFTVSLTLEPREITMPADATLEYRAVVVAKPLQGGPHRTIAEADGISPPHWPAVIRMTSAGLPKGVYRLKAVASVREVGTTRPAALAAVREDEILHVNNG